MRVQYNSICPGCNKRWEKPGPVTGWIEVRRCDACDKTTLTDINRRAVGAGNGAMRRRG